MTLQTVQTFRMATGVWAAIAVAYGAAWQLSFITPLFTLIFLTIPAWIGWNTAIRIIIRLCISLLAGLAISEYLLGYPVICILVYGLLFFFINYNNTPSAPPFSVIFMTLGITVLPIMGLSGISLSHFIAGALLFNMTLGLIFAWLFHTLIPNSLAKQSSGHAAPQKPSPPSLPPREERVRMAFISTIVILSAVTLFFTFNLASYAFAMVQICFMAGAPTAKASLQAMKAGGLATCIGGIAIIIAYNLLVAVPEYHFLLALTLFFSFFFSRRIFDKGKNSQAYVSAFTTFLVLLGTSTMPEKDASTNFYLRIGMILFAGLYSSTGIVIVNDLMRRSLQNKFLNVRPDNTDLKTNHT